MCVCVCGCISVWVLACVCHRMCVAACVCECECVHACLFALRALPRVLPSALSVAFCFLALFLVCQVAPASACLPSFPSPTTHFTALTYPPPPALSPFLHPLSLCCAISREVTAHQSKRSLPASEMCVCEGQPFPPPPLLLLSAPLYCCLTCAINTLYEHLKLFHFAATFEYRA